MPIIVGCQVRIQLEEQLSKLKPMAFYPVFPSSLWKQKYDALLLGEYNEQTIATA